MADNTWAPSPPRTETGPAGATSQDGGAYNTSQLQAALPTAANPAVSAAWGERTGYDYQAYGFEADHQWDSSAPKYEWDGEQGEIGPEFPALEMELFGDPALRGKRGIDFSK
jgi:ATP-dependent RNA helicase DDX3X